ncbi:MAG TPA: hypothetical protein VFK03_03825, partial [Candidatus Saccharimonadales bacterium]|nr:hypothetical protein [Candidatus Saccharimonadales bacterium]
DILLPKGMLDQLLASNSTASNVAKAGNSLAVVNNDDQSINNDLNLAANSGTASVTGNTSAGNATSGQAKTSLTVLNFSGHQVADTNTLLVFVNVLGHWVGMIFDAPAGATAAALGGNVSSSAVSSGNTTVNNSVKSQINNHLTATATSGDASVTHNTQAGDATSGDASVAVNVLNLTDSQISSANWFGVLFINILGNWFGSFGIDTAAGNPPTTSGGKGGSNGPSKPTGSPQPEVFKFTPHVSNLNSYSPLNSQTLRALGAINSTSGSDDPSAGASGSVLSAADPAPSEANNPAVPMTSDNQEQQKDQPNWLVLSLMLSAGAAMIGRQLLLMLQRARLRHLY